MKFFRRKPVVTEQAAIDPDYIQASSIEEYFNRGMVYYSQEKFEQAIQDFQQASSLDANAVDPYYGLGLVYKAQEKNEDAIKAFEQVLRLINEGVLDQNFDRKNMLQRISKAQIQSLSETQ
jgi:tetratricopeptide (TPR) repeat protein